MSIEPGYITLKGAGELVGMTAHGIKQRVRRGEIQAKHIPAVDMPKGQRRSSSAYRVLVRIADVKPKRKSFQMVSGDFAVKGHGKKRKTFRQLPKLTDLRGLGKELAASQSQNGHLNALVGKLAKHLPDHTGAALIEIAEDLAKS